MLEYIYEHKLISSYFAGFLTAIAFFVYLWIKGKLKLKELSEEREELEQTIKELRRQIYEKRNYLEEGLKEYELEKKHKIEQYLEAWKRQQQEKFNEYIARKRGEALQTIAKEVAQAQEQVYKDTCKALEKAYKENSYLRQEIQRLRKELSSWKNRFSNHVISVVTQAKKEILIHALRQRSDKREILNALKR